MGINSLCTWQASGVTPLGLHPLWVQPAFLTCRILTTLFSRALPLLALQLVGLGMQEETFDEIRLVVYHVTLRLDAVFPEVQAETS